LDLQPDDPQLLLGLLTGVKAVRVWIDPGVFF
jgi:hypothetical protein